MISYLKEILYLLGESKKKLAGILCLFLGLSFLDLVGIGLIGPYVSLLMDPGSMGDDFNNFLNFFGLPTDQEKIVANLGIFLIALFLVKAVISIGINWIVVSFSQNLQVDMRSYLMNSYQELPYTEYVSRNSSEYIVNIMELTGRYQAIVLSLLRTMGDFIVSVFILTFLGYTNIFALFLLAILLTTMIFGFDKLFKRKLIEYGEDANKALNKVLKNIHEGIEGLKEIRVLGKEGYFYNNLLSGAKDLAYFQTRQIVVSTSPRFLLELILIFFVVMLVISASLLGEGIEVLAPTLAIFAVASLRLLPAATGFSSNLANIRYGRDSVSRLYADYRSCKDRESLVHLKKSSIVKSETFENLKVQNVSFTYPGTKQEVIKNVSLEISSGESIGFIGPSGSGKTTLVDLILGLLDGNEGSITYNGKNINLFTREWQSKVAYLPQEIFLIDDTLKANIALGVQAELIEDKKIEAAISKAQLRDIVNQLPSGLDTIVGEKGVKLSGGQRQRVALARAFFHERNFLILDEATSALDSETENEIAEEIKLLKGEQTVIVIAHRHSTISNCDRIYEINHGRIVAQGNPQNILKI